MFAFWGGLIIVLHGLVHLWYVTLSQKLVPFQPEMGWTGTSWLLTQALGDAPTRTLAAVFYTLATLVMVVGGIGLMASFTWCRPVLAGAAIVSSVTLLVFWDGSANLIVQKGLVGLVINAILLAALAVL
jgi:hypothetical protein